MEELDDRIDGPFLVEEDLLLGGLIAGDATVAPGVTFEVSGMVTGGLVVEGAPGPSFAGQSRVRSGMVGTSGYLELLARSSPHRLRPGRLLSGERLSEGAAVECRVLSR